MVRKVGIKSKDIDLSAVEYTDADAVAAMGAKADANPLHHDRYTDAEVNALIAAALPSYIHTSICFAAYSGNNGTWTYISSGSVPRYGIWYNSTTANGDYVEYTIWLPAGTYKSCIKGWKHTSLGILDVLVDGVEEGSQDWYNATQSYATLEFDFVVATTKEVTIKLILDGKNGSSTDYAVYLDELTIGRAS